jgi:STE24 endopeptidase
VVDQTPQAAKRYQAMKNRLFLLNIILSFLFLLLFVLTGLSQSLKTGLAQINFLGGFAQQNAAYFTCFVALAFILSFPLEYYEGFVIEHKFGLSTQGLRSWTKDSIKKAVVSFAVSLVLIEAVYYFLLKFPQTWWLWAAVFWFIVSIVLTRIAPRVLLPLFFKYEPLSPGPLRDKVAEFLNRFKIAAQGVYVLDFSKKTVKANALVSGLGATKRIFFSDTMVKEFSNEEILAVLAHEVGHYLGGDTFKLSLWNLCSGFFSCFVASLCLEKLFPVFGLGAISDIAGLPLFIAVLMSTALLLLPAQNGFSRHLEKKADIFALKATGDKYSFISMMRRLANRNFSELSPSRIVEIFLYDHPPIAKRIRLAETLHLGE